MAKFSTIAKGFLARRRNLECTTLFGEPFTYDLKLLDGAEEKHAIAEASKQARDAGGQPIASDPTFAFAFACEICAAAAVDPESPDNKPERLFDGGVAQVNANLDRERILLISEQQRAFQEEIGPRKLELSANEYVAAVLKFASEAEGIDHPFWAWPRPTQLSFMRSTCGLLVSSQTLKLLPGSKPVDAATT